MEQKTACWWVAAATGSKLVSPVEMLEHQTELLEDLTKRVENVYKEVRGLLNRNSAKARIYDIESAEYAYHLGAGAALVDVVQALNRNFKER